MLRRFIVIEKDRATSTDRVRSRHFTERGAEFRARWHSRNHGGRHCDVIPTLTYEVMESVPMSLYAGSHRTPREI